MNKLSDKIKLILREEKYKQIITFAVIGLINTLVDIAVSFILNGFFGVYYVICQISGYSAGTLNSFFLNRFFTFKAKDSKSLPQFIKFVLLNLVSLGVTLVALHILINELFFNFYISKIFVTLLSLSINFIGSKFWVFKKTTSHI